MSRWVAVALIALALPAAAQEHGSRFTLLQDGADGLWLVDGAEGKVARCRQGQARSPRVIDFRDGVATARERGGAGSEPLCTDWVSVAAPQARVEPRVLGGVQ